jgi:hypothetical protein
MRKINDILLFREDISPFLVHLTRTVSEKLSAKEVLVKIIEERQLQPGDNLVSDARFGMKTYGVKKEDLKKWFGALCFTETPINEIHCLLEIADRQVELQPYGLVFLKSRLQGRSVSPVFYINNECGDMDKAVRALCSISKDHPEEAAEILPLISVFGNRFTPPGGTFQTKEVDFRWEREWRLPSMHCPLEFTSEDVFVGVCPHSEIDDFEKLFPKVGFIDPTRNMKWYATKLIKARQRLELKDSVV